MQMPFGWSPIGSALPSHSRWSAFTALTAVANSVATLLDCRLLLGVGEAGAYVSCAKVTANWFPRSERGLASSVLNSGSFIVPLVVAGGFCLLAPAAYLFLVGEIAPLPLLLDGPASHRASAAE